MKFAPITFSKGQEHNHSYCVMMLCYTAEHQWTTSATRSGTIAAYLKAKRQIMTKLVTSQCTFTLCTHSSTLQTAETFQSVHHVSQQNMLLLCILRKQAANVSNRSISLQSAKSSQ